MYKFFAAAFAVLMLSPGTAPPGGFAALDDYVRAQMADAHLPGLALGLVHAGQIVHLEGFGVADPAGKHVTPETPFIIGSVSKSFTALAVMQLVDTGQVDLDTPAVTYVPDFKLAGSSDSNRITVRQLLNQTSGIPTSAGIVPLSRPITSLDGQVRALASIAPSADPGASYAYSNANYEVLGRLVEDVSGSTYGAYLQDRVLTPLGMTNSFTSEADAERGGLAGGCQIWFGADQCFPPGYGFRPDFVPAGFVMSSAEDMARYLVAQMGGVADSGKGILSPTDFQVMHTPVANAGLSGQGGGYGMGWFVGSRAGIAHTIWHDGSAAGNHSMVLLLPEAGWGIVVLTNAESLLYSMLNRIDIIADGIAARLVGSRDPGTLAGLYYVFDALLVLLFALQIRTLLRLLRRRNGFKSHKSRAVLVLLEIALPVWRELLVPIALLIALPAVLSAPWANLIQTDVGVALLVLAVVLLLTGALRVYKTRTSWMGARRIVPGARLWAVTRGSFPALM